MFEVNDIVLWNSGYTHPKDEFVVVGRVCPDEDKSCVKYVLRKVLEDKDRVFIAREDSLTNLQSFVITFKKVNSEVFIKSRLPLPNDHPMHKEQTLVSNCTNGAGQTLCVNDIVVFYGVSSTFYRVTEIKCVNRKNGVRFRTDVDIDKHPFTVYKRAK